MKAEITMHIFENEQQCTKFKEEQQAKFLDESRVVQPPDREENKANPKAD